MRTTFFATVSAIALLTSACTGDSDRPVADGEGLVRAINTIPSAPEFVFLIEERIVGGVGYPNSSQLSRFDGLEYSFNFDVRLPDTVGAQRVASVPVNVEADHLYTFLITGDIAAPDIIVWDYAVREFAESETIFQARFGHTAEAYGPVDIYFAPPGIAPATGESVATLEFGELSAPIEREAGDYVYTITSAGNPGDILFESNSTVGTPRTSFIITPYDGTANTPGPISVRIINDAGGTSSLADINVSPTIRFIHASMALATSDVFVDEMLTEQILANHAYRDTSEDLDITAGEYTFTYTAAGNPGSVLLETSGIVFPASRVEVYAVGEAGALATIITNPDRRSVETLTRFSFTHAAFNHPAVDLYVVEAGTALEDTLFPVFAGIPPGIPPVARDIDQGDLELYLTVAGEKTIIAGPIALTAALGDVFQYIAYDNVDPATADLVEISLP